MLNRKMDIGNFADISQVKPPAFTWGDFDEQSLLEGSMFRKVFPERNSVSSMVLVVSPNLNFDDLDHFLRKNTRIQDLEVSSIYANG